LAAYLTLKKKLQWSFINLFNSGVHIYTFLTNLSSYNVGLYTHLKVYTKTKYCEIPADQNCIRKYSTTKIELHITKRPVTALNSKQYSTVNQYFCSL